MDQLFGIGLGVFLILLGLGLVAESFGFIKSRVTERSATTWKMDIQRTSREAAESEDPRS